MKQFFRIKKLIDYEFVIKGTEKTTTQFHKFQAQLAINSSKI